METFLFLLKPDNVIRRQSGVEVLKAIHDMPGLTVMAFAEAMAPRALAELHYHEHAGKPFFPRLVNILTMKPGVVVVCFQGPEGSIAAARKLVGPTIVTRAKSEAPESLRGQHGLFEGINGIHCSDGPKSGLHETNLWCGTLGLTLDHEKGEKAFQEYIAKWDGKQKEDKAINKVAEEAKEKVLALKRAILAETDLDEDTVKGLMAVICSAMAAM